MMLNRKYNSPQLEESIIKLGLTQFDVKDDGDCLFHSLCKVFDMMGRSQGSAIDIREKVVSYIRGNPEIYSYVSLMGGYENEEVLKEELALVAQPMVYEVPIFDLFPTVISELFHVQLCVYPWQKGDTKGIDETDAEIYSGISDIRPETPLISLLYVNGIHYKPLVSTKLVKEQENAEYETALLKLRAEMKAKNAKDKIKQNKKLAKSQGLTV